MVRAICAIEEAPYPYVITACPNGEGAWFAQTAQRDSFLAGELKQNYRTRFSSEFAQIRAKWVREAKNPLNFIDVGGLISEENRLIMAQATHAVILAKNDLQRTQWQQFCEEINLRAIAILYSDYHAKEDLLITQSPL